MYSLTHNRGKSGRRLIHRATRTIAVVAACASLPSAQVAHAQFWQQDAAFAPVLDSPSMPRSQKFTALARQPDGKLLAAGYVERVSGQVRPNPSAPLRFNADGSLDPSFQAADTAAALFLQPDGRIVTSEGARLNTDGSRDLTFHLASNLRTVEAMDTLGRLYARRNDGVVVRTTPDGVDDGQFRSQVGTSVIRAITPFADGSAAVALVTGPYLELQIARLRPDGSEDPGFRRYSDSTQPATFLGLIALPDGKALFHGTTQASGGLALRFVRLGRDGTADYVYVAPPFTGTSPRASDVLTTAGVVYDLLREAQATVGTRVRASMFGNAFTVAIDVGIDGTLWLASTVQLSSGLVARYTRASSTDLTIDPRPTILYNFVPSSGELLMGQSWRLYAPPQGGLFPLRFQWLKDGQPLPGATEEWLDVLPHSSGDAGNYTVTISNAYGSVTPQPMVLAVDTNPAPLVITAPLKDRAVTLGTGLTWWLTATGNPYPSFQWTKNGSPVDSGTGGAQGGAMSTVGFASIQPEHTGIYEVTATSGNTSKPMTAILGVLSDQKTVGAAAEVGHDIVHPNKNVYDQVLMTGGAAAVTADPNQVTRVSFVDLTGDIVQVEMSGAGTLALGLANASSPAPAASYNQPGVLYVRGHPGLVVAGADETTNLSVFSVGRVTAVNQALFRDDVDYDGLADVAFIAITTTSGRFGGLRTANVRYYADKGLTGVYAPGVTFAGPVYVGDIDAFDTATPVLVLEGAQELLITGGDLKQTNGEPVRIGELTPTKFTAGTTSHGEVLPVQPNQATFQPFNSP